MSARGSSGRVGMNCVAGAKDSLKGAKNENISCLFFTDRKDKNSS